IMEELSKKVKKLNQDPDILDVIIENEDEIINNTLYEKGISQGIEQKAEEIAKKLLKNNVDLDIIANSTGLSKKQIKELQN
ncbi:MAG: hypothetical protein IKF37_02910, partial [Bacilli bacterium]|nr:hypothetical protein [Bacilli bacterium]